MSQVYLHAVDLTSKLYVKMGPIVPENKAIMISECGIIKNVLRYKDVYEIHDNIIAFILKYIREEHQCVGLRMSHNIYIPSLVLSLQELRHSFIFLPDDGTAAQSVIDALEIVWVLTFDSTTTCVGILPLNTEKLYLEKYPNRSKSYENICYIVGTSGTTGQSKFVKVGNSSIESNVKSLTKLFDITASDVIYFGSPLTFDPSMIELLLALHNGACLLMTPPNVKVNHYLLCDTLFHSKNGISVLQMVPSVFMRWSRQQIQSILVNPSLKILAFGGECFPESVLCYERSTTLRIFNLYGVTEVSCWATAHEVQLMQTTVPIGRELDDTLIEVRNDDGFKITEGVGEIYIGSHSRICFVDDESMDSQTPIFRATGDIVNICSRGVYYAGRKNDVFKRLGHKLHLSKIEELIRKETDMINKCVWSNSQSKLLVFLIIDDYDANMKRKILDKFRIKLLHTLPEYCLPDYVDIVRKCPVTIHGKIDVTVLESIFLNREKTKAVDGVEMFKFLLCKYFGINKDELKALFQSTFFEIGGNSIIAVQLLSELRDDLGLDYDPDFVVALFEKDLSACLDCLEHIKATNVKRFSRHTEEDNCLAKKIKLGIELKIAWTYDLRACVDSTPLVFHYKNRLLVSVGSFSHIFVVADGCTGEEVSKFVLPDVVESSPCVSPCGAYLFIGCFNGKMYCLDYLECGIKWTYTTQDRIKCSAVLCQKSAALVFGSYDKYVHCVDILDGKLIWKTSTSEGIISTPLLHESKIYIATICGTCLCLSESTGDILWNYINTGPIFGAPCFLNSCIMWPDVQGKIICLTTQGQKRWQYECGGHLYSSLLAYKNLIVFGCHDHKLYIIQDAGDVPTAKLVVNLDNTVSSMAAVCELDGEDFIVVASTSGHLTMINLEGVVVGEVILPNQVFSSITVHERKIYVGCRDNNLYCIEIIN